MATRSDVIAQYSLLGTRLSSVDPFIAFKTKARLKYVFANIDTWLATDVWNPDEDTVATECLNNIEIINGYLDFVAIIIAGGGGSSTYTNLTPVPTTVGGISAGSTFSAKTMEQMWNQLLYPELFPTLTAPSSALALTQAGFREIGEIVTLNFTATFNRGSIAPAYGTSGYRSGLPNNYNYGGSGLPADVASVALTNSQNVNNYTVLSGVQSWTGSVDYNIGEQPLSSIGNNYSTPLAAGTTSNSTVSITGVYPVFATTVNITTMTKQTLVANGSVITTNLIIEDGVNKQSVEFPSTWGAITTLEQWNSLGGTWDPITLTDFTVTSITNTIQGASVNYDRYTYNGPTIGSRILRWTV